MLLTWYTVASIATFVVYWLDKRRAQLGERRVPEKTLHVLAAAGGFAGAWAAMRIVRHKNRKAWFVAVTAAITLAHALAWVCFAVW